MTFIFSHRGEGNATSKQILLPNSHISVDLKQKDCQIFLSKDGFIWDPQRTVIWSLEIMDSHMQFFPQQGNKSTFTGRRGSWEVYSEQRVRDLPLNSFLEGRGVLSLSSATVIGYESSYSDLLILLN